MFDSEDRGSDSKNAQDRKILSLIIKSISFRSEHRPKEVRESSGGRN